MTVPEIRPATFADLDPLVELMDELRQAMAAINPAAEVLDPATLRKYARGYLTGPGNLVLLALDGGGPVGFLRANVRLGELTAPLPGQRLPWREALRRRINQWRGRKPGPPVIYIAELSVRPGHRRQGLARALLAEAEAALAFAGAETAYLRALADNDEGLAFWQSAGFRGETVFMVKRKKSSPAGDR